MNSEYSKSHELNLHDEDLTYLHQPHDGLFEFQRAQPLDRSPPSYLKNGSNPAFEMGEPPIGSSWMTSGDNSRGNQDGRDELLHEEHADGNKEHKGYTWQDLQGVDPITRALVFGRSWVYEEFKRNKTLFVRIILATLFVLYFVFFGFAISTSWDTCHSYCDGVKFLFIITVFSFAGLVYFQIVKRFFGKFLNENMMQPLDKLYESLWKYFLFRWAVYLLLIGGAAAFLIVDSYANRRRLISVAGLLTLLLLGYIFSRFPSRIRWRHVAWGVGLQFVLALLILRWEVGQEVFSCLGDKVQTFLNYTNYGSSFVFGYLVTGVMQGWVNPNITINGQSEIYNGTIPLPVQQQLFGFQVLPVMFYFSFFISILFYYGIMQWLVQKLGWLLQVSVGTTACESINAAACIFVGQTEAPLLIKPYLNDMTKSEIHAVMTGGFANVAGSTLAAYISFGIPANHLLTASVMSAPAALGFAKLMLPESEESKTLAANIKIEETEDHNALEAAANGASIAISLVANIAANLIAFIAFIYFLDGVLSWMGALVGCPQITFEWLLSYIFTPLAFLMGVEWDDCQNVGKLIGLKTIINEFVAYEELGNMMAAGTISARSATIATYALCGFSNLSSIGIQLGCLGPMAPNRKTDLAQVVLRALISGSAACFMTACVAGSLIN